MLDPPVRDGEGEDDVEDDGRHRDAGEAPVEAGGQHRRRHHQLEGRRPEVEDDAAQQEIGRARTAIDHSRQGPGLLAVMKVQRQGQGVAERLLGASRQGSLRDGGEDRVPQVGRDAGDEPQRHPAEGEAGEGDEGGGHVDPAMVDIVDRRLDQQRPQHAGQLADQHQRQSEAEARLQAGGA